MRISKLVFPRPVALITTEGGEDNVATYSFVTPISFKPKLVAFSVAPSRHSFQLLKENEEFVFHMIGKDLLDEALYCGSKSGRDVDKFEETDLKKIESEEVKPPTIKQCPIALEAEVRGMEEYGDHYLVVGEVVHERIKGKDFKPLLHISGDRFAVAEEFEA